MALRDQQDLEVPQVLREFKDHPVQLEPKEFLVRLAPLVLKA